MQYWYKYKLAKNGDICLATKDPQEYCNGFYRYNTKDPGDGKEFVVIEPALCCFCEERLATTGYDMRFCEECWKI
jgi:hypothetical protein